MRYTYRYRTFFWPALLILGGVVALLVNTGQIPVDRLYQLVNLWPVILVVIGLELIIRRTVHGLAGDVAAALIILIAIVGAAAYVTVGPNPAATHTLDASSQAGDVTQASLEIDAGASTVTISGSSEVGADLYHAHIEYSGAKPRVDVDGARGVVHISQANNNFAIFQPRHFTANVQLNPGIAWAIQVNGGASTTTINVPQLRVTSIEINSGAAHDEITLGPASGKVPVQISGGALTVHVHRPSGTQALVQVAGGALTLDADGRSMHGIGKLGYQSPGFSDASDGYTIQVSGGACTASLDTKTESG